MSRNCLGWLVRLRWYKVARYASLVPVMFRKCSRSPGSAERVSEVLEMFRKCSGCLGNVRDVSEMPRVLLVFIQTLVICSWITELESVTTLLTELLETIRQLRST